MAWEEWALSARTRAGRVRGRPGPERNTLMAAMTASNRGASPRWPAVTTGDSSFWPCSHARYSLVDRPP